jgi:hypothetical protein
MFELYSMGREEKGKELTLGQFPGKECRERKCVVWSGVECVKRCRVECGCTLTACERFLVGEYRYI